MSLTKFAMVEELACLVKDNLPCKHLILSVEEVLVDFLHDDKSTEGVLELEPMNPYERLLIHRLADIFGFSHHSVGEGGDRHIILECCPETSIPPILVTDLLWQIGEVPSPMISHLPGQNKVMTGESSLEERERNYLAARNRIFSADMQTELVKPRPRNDTVVARRMIAHALGKTSKEMTQGRRLSDTRERAQTKDWRIPEVDRGDVGPSNKQVNTSFHTSESLPMSKLAQPQVNSSLHNEGSVTEQMENSIRGDHFKDDRTGAANSAAEQMENTIHKSHLRKEHMGAAKRLFANALGIQNRGIRQPKPT